MPRVSTYGQTLDSQLEQLCKTGCSSRNTYREKVTGARADRRESNRMLGKFAPGDVVTATRIDRLARSPAPGPKPIGPRRRAAAAPGAQRETRSKRCWPS
jgi:DNA invertase Pin-like site-specific DNA recombinase